MIELGGYSEAAGNKSKWLAGWQILHPRFSEGDSFNCTAVQGERAWTTEPIQSAFLSGYSPLAMEPRGYWSLAVRWGTRPAEQGGKILWWAQLFLPMVQHTCWVCTAAYVFHTSEYPSTYIHCRIVLIQRRTEWMRMLLPTWPCVYFLFPHLGYACANVGTYMYVCTLE